MKVAHLKEAQQIVDNMAWLQTALTWSLPENAGSGELAVQKTAPRPNYSSSMEKVAISPAAREAAFRVMRREWELRLAELKRRAAQLGLVL